MKKRGEHPREREREASSLTSFGEMDDVTFAVVPTTESIGYCLLTQNVLRETSFLVLSPAHSLYARGSILSGFLSQCTV